MLRKAHDLLGYFLLATDGEFGTVDDFYFDDQNWQIRYMIVDTGPWLLGRKVLIAPAALDQPIGDAPQLSVQLTKEQIEYSPSIDLEMPVSRQQEESISEYYQWPAYWTAATVGSAGYGDSTPAPVIVPIEQQALRAAEAADDSATPLAGDPTLRSVKEVMGYNIQATNGDIGHVEDFCIDDEWWAIRYMIVDTRNWLPGRNVLVSPWWIDRVSWQESNVHVKITREAIEQSPEYNPEISLDRDYEAKLYDFYGFRKYWT